MGPLLLPRLLARGDRVTVLRRGTDYGRPLPAPVEDLRADRATDAFDAALGHRRFDAVVDFAAYEGGEVERLARVLGGRIGQYLLVSTGQVYLVREGLEPPYREDDYEGPTIARPADDADVGSWEYGMGKRAAEDTARARGLPLTTLRIPIVHGLGDPEHRLLAYLARVLDGGPVLLPDGGSRRVRHVFADAVVDTIAALLGAPDTRGAFNQTHDETPTLAALVGELFARVGRAPDVRAVDPEAIVAAGHTVRDVSPLSSRWASFLDPSRLRARGVGHPPLGEMLAALVHAHLSAGPAIELPTRVFERSFAAHLPAPPLGPASRS